MRNVCRLCLICCLACPLPLGAAEPPVNTASPEARVEFTPRIRKAFDQSGKAVIHSKLPDGSSMADHNATLGHVTLARIGPDGRIETFCTTDETEASAWMSRAGRHAPDNRPDVPASGKPQ